jgi:hypothetical protein
MSSEQEQESHILGQNDQARYTGGQPPQRSAGQWAAWIFLGRYGLRAGWACLLFLLVLFALGWVSSHLLRLLPHSFLPKGGTQLGPLQMIFGEAVSIGVVLLATFILSLIERRQFLSFGLRGRASGTRFFAGLVCGFAAISALVGVLWWRGLLTLASAHLSPARAVEYALAWGFGFFCVAIFEENLLRGYLLYTLRRGIGFCRIRIHPPHQSGRVAGRTFFRRSGRPALLPRHLVYRLAVVGHRVPRKLGLGRKLFLEHARQRSAGQGPSAERAPQRCVTVERRPNRPGGQSLGDSHPAAHGAAHVSLVAAQAARTAAAGCCSCNREVRKSPRDRLLLHVRSRV